MAKIHPTAIIESSVKIGRLNFPTIAVSMILLSVLSLSAIKFNRQLDKLFFGIFIVSGLIASACGFAILVWCFSRRKQFFDESVKKYFRQTVLLGLAAFTSPLWLIILSILIFGINR
jgi:hypothetical protein